MSTVKRSISRRSSSWAVTLVGVTQREAVRFTEPLAAEAAPSEIVHRQDAGIVV